MNGALLATCTRNTCFHSNSSMAERPNSSIATDPWQKGLTLTTHLSSGLTVWQPLLSYQKEESGNFQQVSSCLPLAEKKINTLISSNNNRLVNLKQEQD